MSGGHAMAPVAAPAAEEPIKPQPTAQEIAEIRQRQAKGRTGRSKLVIDPSLAATYDGGGTGLSIY